MGITCTPHCHYVVITWTPHMITIQHVINRLLGGFFFFVNFPYVVCTTLVSYASNMSQIAYLEFLLLLLLLLIFLTSYVPYWYHMHPTCHRKLTWTFFVNFPSVVWKCYFLEWYKIFIAYHMYTTWSSRGYHMNTHDHHMDIMCIPHVTNSLPGDLLFIFLTSYIHAIFLSDIRSSLLITCSPIGYLMHTTLSLRRYHMNTT